MIVHDYDQPSNSESFKSMPTEIQEKNLENVTGL